MASKFFNSRINLAKALKGMKVGDNVMLELSQQATFFDVQKNIQSYATRYKVKVTTESLRAIGEDDRVIRLVRLTFIGVK